MFFSHLEELRYVLKENYASYRVKPAQPAQQPQGGYSEDALMKAINNNVNNFANLMFTQMFKAAAPENVRRLLFHKDHTRLMVEEAYKVFFTDHRLKMDKKATSVHAVTEEQEAVTPDQDIEAFRLQQGFSRPNINNCQNSNQPRLNASQNGKFCVYCKILNHSQEECRKCIQDNKPCVTNKGQLYWPKVNSTKDNPNAMQNNSNPNNGVSSVYL